VYCVPVSLEISFPNCPIVAQYTSILFGDRDLQLASCNTETTKSRYVLGVVGCRDLQLALYVCCCKLNLLFVGSDGFVCCCKLDLLFVGSDGR